MSQMHPFEIVDRYFRVNVFSLGGVLSSVAYKCRLHIRYIGSSVVDPLWVCKTFSDYEKYLVHSFVQIFATWREEVV